MQFVLFGVLAASLALVSWFVWRLNFRVTSALGGADASKLEDSLAKYFQSVKKLEDQTGLNTDQIAKLSARLDLASQKISLVRFNPFGDTGGDQSFSLAVLDANNSGYVITSIHGRENTRSYIKPIDLGVSKYTLSSEEKKAIEQASQRVPKYKQPGESHGKA